MVNTTNKKNDNPPIHQVYPILTACRGKRAGCKCKKTFPRTAYILCLLVRGTPDLKIDFHTGESFKYSNMDFFLFFLT